MVLVVATKFFARDNQAFGHHNSKNLENDTHEIESVGNTWLPGGNRK